MDTARYTTSIAARLREHDRFWTGDGPSLLLVPRRERALYDLDGYRERFEDPARMLEFELGRAREVVDWPTDGIPTARPSLGTILVPASLGQPYEVRTGSMPWPGEPLSREEIRGIAESGIRTRLAEAELIQRAIAFYEQARDHPDVYPYHADTQGVFDIAHLLYGTDIFTDLTVEEEGDWVMELMELCLEAYLEATKLLKRAIGEPVTEMVHGHGTEQGLYFPSAGARISEDTATLLSPEMIERDLLPFMERSATPYGGAFVHYCGKHDFFFRLLCEQPWCRAIDLGNPEMYELPELLEICASTDTVYYSRVAALDGETPTSYIERIGTAVRDTGVRCVIRPLVFPETQSDAAEMLERFHSLTS
jgi:hypothetical protein